MMTACVGAGRCDHHNSDVMETRVVLFRGVNVGGNNILPMKELTRDLQSLGLAHVKTYIQSGNVVVRSQTIPPALATRIAAAIENRHGFRPAVFILTPEQLERVIAQNPFPEAESEPRALHVFFLASAPVDADEDALAGAASPNEQFHLTDEVLYLHAPGGVARSKLASNATKYLGVSVTARNWRTVRKLWAMVQTS